MQTDILIIGSGIAGLTYAIKVAQALPDKQITILTKSELDHSNTKYAQGGIAVVCDSTTDSFASHIEDTMRASAYTSNASIVQMVVTEAPARLEELLHWRVGFDKKMDGSWDLGKEGGHSQYRIIHHKDVTGHEVELKLLETIRTLPNIKICAYQQAANLILDERTNACIGAYVFDLKENIAQNYYAQITVLATGGCGQVYHSTTNPAVATGDGISMAAKIGASTSGMQFIQFHPTAFLAPSNQQYFLISEAVRGFGAYLCLANGQRFMHKYDERLELASRDIVSKAIYQEMQSSDSSIIYLDCRHLDREAFQMHFPNIYEKCLSEGYDICEQLLPIMPVAHYLCGGIDVDKNAATNINGLYAIGECANTGLHGANRLASNSLLEALVYAHNAYLHTMTQINENKSIIDNNSVVSKIIHSESANSISSKIKENVRKLMDKYVGIVRSNEGLKYALQEINKYQNTQQELAIKYPNHPKINTLEHMLHICQQIISQSIQQKNNIGTFLNIDLV